MNFIDKIKQSETMKGLFLAHLIILLQLLVIAIIGMTVVFIGGLARYLLWVLLGGGALVLVLAYVI
ncbi:MAG: hypothetical protein WBN43_09450, partial [Thiogranum sp.]